MTVTADCPHCGATVTARDEDELVTKAQDHMREAHGFTPAIPREHIRARLRHQQHRSSDR